MDYEKLLEDANKLLYDGSVEEIDDFLPELMRARDILDLECRKQKIKYDDTRDNMYLSMKKQKERGEIKSSDKDIEVIARVEARRRIGDPEANSVIVWHYAKYIDMLNSKKIGLMRDDKQKREMMGDNW